MEKEIESQELYSAVIGIMAGIGASAIASNIITSFIPKNVALPMKLCMLLGRIVICSAIAALARDEIADLGRKIDACEEKLQKILSEKKLATA